MRDYSGACRSSKATDELPASVCRCDVFRRVCVFGGYDWRRSQSATKLCADGYALLYISTLFFCINSLTCFNRSVVLTCSMSTARLKPAVLEKTLLPIWSLDVTGRNRLLSIG